MGVLARFLGALGLRPRMDIASPVTEGGWYRIFEPRAGDWQRLIFSDAPKNLLAYAPIYACVTRIAADVAKLCLDLYEEQDDDTWLKAVSTSPYRAVIQRPNHYQNRIQFYTWWIVSKLLSGNSYALKERDRRGLVASLYVLDPRRVTPLVTPSGDVYYDLQAYDLAGIATNVTVPASEIIHDRMECLWHPLVGISPLYAAALSGTLGRRIQENSTRFFSNLSRPSGILTAPGKITDTDAKEYKARWQENYGGNNIGQIAVLGNGLEYKGVGTIPANEAQLVDQLKLTREDIATAFRVPLFKLGGPLPQGVQIADLDLTYYKDCLQSQIESIELCLDEGLELPSAYHTMFEVDDLLRMDAAKRFEAYGVGVKGGWMHPNYARARENMPPAEGGDTPYLQQQNFALSALAKRDALPNPFVIDRPTANPTPSEGGAASTADPAQNDSRYAARAQLDALRDELRAEARALAAAGSAEMNETISRMQESAREKENQIERLKAERLATEAAAAEDLAELEAALVGGLSA